ncbi:GBS Bsp-like repeat-containing protein [Streptococcus sp. 121]|uniref:GBS Bsp-like repeat-containing protein n=1 Tax=Streptococcus sp. 121 TaxID=2797637 RepID=UPI0018F071C8|nr:GBS Bsp-like repeat-containing protein [Streptococcus sp. 121]MBJ6745497.1 GBS Bsp-like repeat-containing protein [Streptococcus sp. 121]
MNQRSQQRFSIRKYSFGAASVLIASLVFMGGQVQADSYSETTVKGESSSQTVTSEPQANGTLETNPSSELVTPQTSLRASLAPSTEVATSPSSSSKAVSSSEASASTEETSTLPSVNSASIKTESVQPASATPFRRAATSGSAETSNQLPNSGTYVFEEVAEVHSEPRLASSVVATYSKGQSVVYDQVLNREQRQWLSYIGASGARRYVALPAQNNAGQTTDSAVANTLKALAPQGTYTFSQTAGVKNEARITSPDLATYRPGQSVRYDRVLNADNYTWISYISYSGTRRYVAIGAQSIQPSRPVTPEVKVEKTGRISTSSVSASGFEVVVSNVNHPQGVKEVLVPTWSEKNGQDDLIWHKAVKQADGRYKVRIETKDHKNDAGSYVSHIYYVTNQNNREYVTGTKVTVPQAPVVQKTGQVTGSNISSTGFDVVVSQVNHPQGVKEVLVPTWSEKNGQDDLIWHKAVKQADGSYKVRIETKDHKNDAGSYVSHVYYVTNQNNREYVTGTKVTVPQAPVVQKTGQVTGSNISSTGFDVVVSQVNHPQGVKEVLVPTWSEKNGQDDLIWHKAVKQADGSYKVRIETKDHKNDAGSYLTHVYYVTNQNKREFLSGTRVTVPQKTIVVSRPIPHNLPAQGSYTFTKRSDVKNEPVVTSPTLAVYEVGNKVNYDRIVTTNGYHWLSYISYTGQRRYVAYGPSHTLEEKKEETQGNQSSSGKGLPEKWVGNKKYSGTVTHIDENPVYSDKNRVKIDRIVIHHNAGMSDEGARATWYIRNGNETSAHYQVTPDKIWGVVPENEVAWHAGHYPTNQRSIGIEHLNNSLGPHWTIAEATYRNSAKLIADISLRYDIPLDRNHVVGHDEVSATLCPGGIDIDKLLALAKIERAKLEKTTLPNTSAVPSAPKQVAARVEIPYYSQLDSRWSQKWYGGYKFGPTGCVPTSLAMVFSGLSGKTVLPTEVGDYIYHNTNAFNKFGPGTETNGIVKAVNKWGYKHEVLNSRNAIQAALQAGNPVLLAVGASVFVNYPSTHEIVLSEYKDGKVKVSDPYTKSLSGWHSLDYLWNVRSRVAEDNQLGSPAIAVKRA